ncbi:hypothetical protein SUGI_0007900 [Cryptomeria japonica]|uniref:F-box/kelch-repeat protein SKIP4 isoform X2 n=1 Tax=Cryptomeria japonica TaxID=3369 RepID=UPI002408D9B4|nr:F-box/kelch-repeat protein SKIP4 isoform X2 [Cryptomeria japonica]GLJ04966.1 hypothetical protein SUGI_0007900 [Cryptomeria japonica]
MEGILIPGLPNDVALQILARIPREYYCEAIPRVSSSWREAVKSPELFALRKRLRVTESWIYAAVKDPFFIRWCARNSTAEDSEWWPLPLMREEHRPICGFSCAVIGELLFVIGGCEVQEYGSHWPAINKVGRDPIALMIPIVTEMI